MEEYSYRAHMYSTYRDSVQDYACVQLHSLLAAMLSNDLKQSCTHHLMLCMYLIVHTCTCTHMYTQTQKMQSHMYVHVHIQQASTVLHRKHLITAPAYRMQTSITSFQNWSTVLDSGFMKTIQTLTTHVRMMVLILLLERCCN